MYSELGCFDKYIFLDLFAGSGQIGQTARDKGFKSVSQCDIKPIHHSIAQIDILSQQYKSQVLYDVIFADPPYIFTEEQFRTILVNTISVLDQDGLFIFEIESKKTLLIDNLINSIDLSLKIYKTKKYGNTTLIFICHR